MTTQSSSIPITTAQRTKKAGSFLWALAGLAIWPLMILGLPRFLLRQYYSLRFGPEIGFYMYNTAEINGLDIQVQFVAVGIVAIAIQIVWATGLRKFLADSDQSALLRLRSFGIGSLVPVGLLLAVYAALLFLFSHSGSPTKDLLAGLGLSVVMAVVAGGLAGSLPMYFLRGRMSHFTAWALIGSGSLLALGLPQLLTNLSKPMEPDAIFVSTALLGTYLASQAIASHRSARTRA